MASRLAYLSCLPTRSQARYRPLQMSADGFICRWVERLCFKWPSHSRGRIGEPRGSHIMKHAILLLAIAAAVCAPASALAQANVGGYYAPIPAPPPPVVYQSHYAPPGAYGAPGTYVYQSHPPPIVYRVPPVVSGHGNGQAGGSHRGWEY